MMKSSNGGYTDTHTHRSALRYRGNEFDPSQPRVPAGRGWTLDSAHLASYEESVSDVVEQLRAAMESGELKSVFGLRVDDIDSPGAKGDGLLPSRVWKNVAIPRPSGYLEPARSGLASADKECEEKSI